MHTVINSKKGAAASKVGIRSEDGGTDTLLGSGDNLAVMSTLTSLRREIEDLKQEVQEIRSTLTVTKMPENADTDVLDAPEGPLETTIETYRRRMNEEVVDRNWAPKMENRIVEALEREVFRGTRLKTVVCRSSVCELTVEHDSEADQIHFSDTFALEGVNSSGGTITPYGNEQEGWGSTGFVERPAPPQPAHDSPGPPLQIPSIYKN